MKPFYNTLVTRTDVLILSERENSIEKFREYISKNIMKLDAEEKKRNEIQIDFLTSVHRFSLKRQFSIEQRSTLLSIALYIYYESLEKKIPSIESHEMLDNILKNHIIQREPYSIKMFTEQDKNEILKFFRATFYRHYTLYEIAGTKFTDYTLLTSKKLEPTWHQVINLNEGEVINPHDVDALKSFFNNNTSPRKNEEALINLKKEGSPSVVESNHSIQKSLPTEQSMEEELVKTDDDLKLEKELDSAFKDFYEKFDQTIKAKDEKIDKLLGVTNPNLVAKVPGQQNVKQNKK